MSGSGLFTELRLFPQNYFLNRIRWLRAFDYKEWPNDCDEIDMQAVELGGGLTRSNSTGIVNVYSAWNQVYGWH